MNYKENISCGRSEPASATCDSICCQYHWKNISITLQGSRFRDGISYQFRFIFYRVSLAVSQQQSPAGSRRQLCCGRCWNEMLDSVLQFLQGGIIVYHRDDRDEIYSGAFYANTIWSEMQIFIVLLKSEFVNLFIWFFTADRRTLRAEWLCS